MSRSYNEIGIPNQRGRKRMRKTKRLSSKRVRQNKEIVTNHEDHALRQKEVLDKDSPISDYEQKVRH
jgi:hypothetical protein